MAIRLVKMCLAAAVLISCVGIAATYADRSENSYEVVVGEQKSDMQRMIDAYERLSTEYLSLVQKNLSTMAAQDTRILEKLNTLEKKIDQLNQRLDAMSKSSAANAAAAPEPSAGNDVKN